MEFTGERFMPEFPSDWGIEHIHRYLLASELCVGKKVLDVASGEGYGSALLADSALHVTGVDISEEAVSFAQEKYLKSNLVYLQGSVTSLPFESGIFDVVVSFETIEHLIEQQTMIDELSRVLRPDGLLIISSPDKLEYSDIPQHKNEFHVKELYKIEFEMLIRSRFSQYHLYGQRLDYGSLIIGDKEAPFFSYEEKNKKIIRTLGISHAMFHIALASNGPLPQFPNSIRKYPLAKAEMMLRKQVELEDWKRHALGLEKIVQERELNLAQRELELSNVGDTLTATRKLLGNVEKRLLEREKQLGDLGEELTSTRISLGRMKENLVATQAELDSVYNSRSWKVTAALRKCVNFFHF